MRYRHLRVNIAGMLKQPDRVIDGTMDDEHGNPMPAIKIRECLLKQLEFGIIYLPVGKCDNWSDTEGCLGHENGGS